MLNLAEIWYTLWTRDTRYVQSQVVNG